MGIIVVVDAVHSNSSPKTASTQTAPTAAVATPNSTPPYFPIAEAIPTPAPTLAPVAAVTPAPTDEVIDENHPGRSDLELRKKDEDIEKRISERLV
jgi:hypothetical protein